MTCSLNVVNSVYKSDFFTPDPVLCVFHPTLNLQYPLFSNSPSSTQFFTHTIDLDILKSILHQFGGGGGEGANKMRKQGIPLLLG